VNLNKEIETLLSGLVGQKPPLDAKLLSSSKQLFEKDNGIGYSQFNEILLLFGYDRISKDFFQYLALKNLPYESTTVIESIEKLEEGIERFRVFAIFRFGNIQYAFKTLSKIGEEESFHKWLETLKPKTEKYYKYKHNQVLSTKEVDERDTFYLGHLVGEELEKELKKNPKDPVLLKEKGKMEEVRKTGSYNFESYLASDHLDVYIATSMRQKHEYIFVNRIAKQIFSDSKIENLNLRWFDPTQAFCINRIDKGLLEGLMLKRAKCTIYLAQETDTFGKDSELASTLAQGKPVIAFVPKGTKKEVNELIRNLVDISEGQKTEFEVIIDQLLIFKPELAWKDEEFKLLLNNPDADNLRKIKIILYGAVKDHYDKRYNYIKCKHPLGIQVNIDTGVANGVLVVRSVKKCVSLLYNLLTEVNLRFRLEVETHSKGEFLLLKEEISDSIFRVITNDKMLTNTFWNYYTKL